MNKPVGALLLAAGFSNRFGDAKLLAPLNSGKTVFAQTLAQLQQGVADIRVITRPELEQELRADAPELIVFSDASQGMGASLAFGMSHVGDWDACLICLADMPFIEPGTYQRIREHARPDHITIPCFEGKSGNPVCFGSDFFAELGNLSGDSGGRELIRQHTDAVHRLPVEDPGVLSDIDTPQDLIQLQSTFA